MTYMHTPAAGGNKNLRAAQARHLRDCGPRCILETLLAVSRGHRLDDVLFDYTRIAPEGYHATLYYGAALSDGDAA